MTHPEPPHRRPPLVLIVGLAYAVLTREWPRQQPLRLACGVYAQPHNVKVITCRPQGKRRARLLLLMDPDASAFETMDLGVPDHVPDGDRAELDDWLYSNFVAQMEARFGEQDRMDR